MSKILKFLIVISIFVFIVCIGVQKYPKVREYIKKNIASDVRAPYKNENIEQKTQSKIKTHSICLFTDSHNYTKGIEEMVSRVNNSDCGFVVGLGDYTNTGTSEEFEKIDSSLSKLSKPITLLPGDHDLWNGRDKQKIPLIYFNQVFGQMQEKISLSDVETIYIDNSDIYKGVSDDNLKYAIDKIKTTDKKTIVIFSHKAIKHPLTIHSMGYSNTDKNEFITQQADVLYKEMLQKIYSKIYLIHGDLHAAGEYELSVNVHAYSIGALTDTKNYDLPSFSIMDIFQDGSADVRQESLFK